MITGANSSNDRRHLRNVFGLPTPIVTMEVEGSLLKGYGMVMKYIVMILGMVS